MASIVVAHDLPIPLRLSERTLSGTVTADGAAAVRKILVYKNNEPGLYTSTWSNASGNWGVSVVGGDNDKFRVVAVGLDGENSQTYAHVVAG